MGQTLDAIIGNLRMFVTGEFGTQATATFDPDAGYPYRPANQSITGREFEMTARDGKRYLISVRQEDV